MAGFVVVVDGVFAAAIVDVLVDEVDWPIDMVDVVSNGGVDVLRMSLLVAAENGAETV